MFSATCAHIYRDTPHCSETGTRAALHECPNLHHPSAPGPTTAVGLSCAFDRFGWTAHSRHMALWHAAPCRYGHEFDALWPAVLSQCHDARQVSPLLHRAYARDALDPFAGTYCSTAALGTQKHAQRASERFHPLESFRGVPATEASPVICVFVCAQSLMDHKMRSILFKPPLYGFDPLQHASMVSSLPALPLQRTASILLP